MRIRAIIFKLHSYLGLISGIFILIFSLSGAILLFTKEIDKATYREILTTDQPDRKFLFDHAYKKVASAYPDYIPYRIFHGINDKEETIEVGLQKDNFKERLSVYLHPTSGKITGKIKNSFTEFILKIHYSFLLGKTGELLAAVFALSLIGSIITGTIVYRKYIFKVFLFRVPVKFKNWRTGSSELHRVLGVWALVFNFILAFTGFWMLKHTFDVKSHFSEPEVKERAAPLVASIDTACIQFKNQLPDITISYISLPRSKGDNLVIYGDTPGEWLYGVYNNYAEFDVHSGKLINIVKEEQLEASGKFDNAIYTLHFGQFGGWIIKIIYTLFSLATSIISITGFFLWYKRNKKKISYGKSSRNRNHFQHKERVHIQMQKL